MFNALRRGPIMTENAKIIEIQSLRGIAVIIVVIAHLGHIVPALDPYLGYFWLGGGVDLFFAVSGFVIARLLFRSERSDFIGFLIPFWKRRVSRLWPAMAFWALVCLALSLVFNASGQFSTVPKNVHAVAVALLQIVNFDLVGCLWLEAYECTYSPLRIYWSLSLEEQFYIIFPVALFFLGIRRVAIAALCLALAQLFLDKTYPSPLWFFRTDAIALGVCIAWLHHSGRADRFRPDFLMPQACAMVGAAVMVTLLIVVARPQVAPFYHGLVALVGALLVFVASFNRGLFLPRGVIRASTAWIGERSYSIYLVHTICFQAIKEIGYRIGSMPKEWPLLAIACAIILTMAAAEFSYRYIEMPMRQRGRAWADRPISTAIG
jgi:peptidoglycan/LPS O-acetylase OafA/YrhL